MLLVVLFLFAPLFTLQTEVILNYNGFNPSATVPSTSATYPSASAGLSPATTRLSPAAKTTYAQQQVHWPPSELPNDWYILRAAPNAAIAAAPTSQSNAKPTNTLHNAHEALARHTQPHSAPHNSYDTPHAAQHQNPVNYYTYNSNSGNYRSPSPETRFVAPYVLTISNQRRPSAPSGERNRRHKLSNNTTDSVLNNRTSVNTYNNNYHNKTASPHNTYDGNEQSATNKVNNAAAIVAQSQHPAVFGWQDIESRNLGEGSPDGNDDKNATNIENVQINSVESDVNSLEDGQFDEVLVPLGNALDNVRHFFEVLRRLVSDDEADSASDNIVTLGSSAEAFTNTACAMAAHSAAADKVIPAVDNAQLSLEVQGQRSPPTATTTAVAHLITQPSQPMMAPALPRSTAVTASARATTTTYASTNTPSAGKSLTSTAFAIGRGKKLKKKLKKLMLPLLLAYKLKFIALVPLLIGGLTLLVGSTGLAGFFFALFLTVMSLKGGGSVNKSIVIKKVW